MEGHYLFTKQVHAGTRVYYIDIGKDRKGGHYLSVTEIPTGEKNGKKKRSKIFIHEGNLETFRKSLDEAMNFLTKIDKS